VQFVLISKASAESIEIPPFSLQDAAVEVMKTNFKEYPAPCDEFGFE
jgi:hypothetical protein